jgi:hypothetical protein
MIQCVCLFAKQKECISEISKSALFGLKLNVRGTSVMHSRNALLSNNISEMRGVGGGGQ